MHFIKTLNALSFIVMATALPTSNPQADDNEVQNTVDGLVSAFTASTGTVCNCANMQGDDLGKALFGINQCTIQIIGNVPRCSLDSDNSKFYICPVVNNTPNCNACPQSLDSSRLDHGPDCAGTPSQG